jgi:hypothetical protein
MYANHSLSPIPKVMVTSKLCKQYPILLVCAYMLVPQRWKTTNAVLWLWSLFQIRLTRVELSNVHFGRCRLLTTRCVTLVLTNIGAIIRFLFPTFSSFSLRLSLCDWGFAQLRMHPPYCLCTVILLITPNKSRRMWLLFLTGFASSYVPNEGF